MPSAILLDRVAFAYSDAVPLFANVDLHLAPGFTGIVGENGAGKSTLLRLIQGELAPTAGRITIEPRDAVIACCDQAVDDRSSDIDNFAARDDASAGRWRGLLALVDDDLARWPTLSPGERRRWQLAAALARDPDILLLDEPTNHVDAAARALVIAALRRYRGIALVISHDRSLLDTLTTTTVRVHAATARAYPGNYQHAKQTWEADEQRARDVRSDAQRTARAAARKLDDARRDRQAAEAERSVARRAKSVHDHDAREFGRKVVINWAEARAGRRVEVARRDADRAEAAIPDAPIARALGRSIFVDYQRPTRRFLFELATPVLRAGATPLLHDVRVAVAPGDRIRVAGANGAGKTTLIHALLAASTLPADRILYLPQELDGDAADTLVTETRALRPTERGRVLSLVAALGVDPDRLLASQSPSPGELRKLALALGLGRHAWCLVLDEPTNHLDLPSIERLEQALAAFPGALLLVTHDDAFAARLTTEAWQLENGRVAC